MRRLGPFALAAVFLLAQTASVAGQAAEVRLDVPPVRGRVAAGASRFLPVPALAAAKGAKRKRLRHLDVRATDLAYSASAARLYVTVGSDSETYPNTLLEVDAKRRTVLHAIPLGGSPSRLSVSDGDRTAHVVVDRSAVKRVDLAARRVVAEFVPRLPSVTEPIFPVSVSGMPGRPETVAVSFAYTEHTGQVGTAIYDGDVVRPSWVPGITAGQLIFDGDVLWANTGLGLNGSALLYRLAVRPEGLVLDDEEPIYAGKNDVWLARGLFYSRTGEIIDAEAREQVGWIPTGGGRVAAHALDLAANRIYFAFDYGATVMYVYDLETQRVVGYFDGEPYRQLQGTYQMVHCGAAGIVARDRYGLTFYPPKVFKTFAPYERPAPVPENGQVRYVRLPNTALIYDDARRRFYATVSPGVPGIGNSIVEVDPYAGRVGRDVLLGSVPGIMALSPDGEDLYVAMWGSYEVKRLRLPDLATVSSFDVTRGPYEANRRPIQTNAQEILPLPGSPGSVVVLYNWQPWYLEQSSEGLAVYDDGARRYTVTPYSGNTPSSVELDETGTAVYGLDGLSTAAYFFNYTVAPNGIFESSRHYNVVGGFFDQLHCANGKCFSDGGWVIDARAGERIGRLPYEYRAFTTVLAAPDPPRGVVYHMIAGDDGFELTSYDMATLRRIGSFRVPPYLSYYVADLLVWDDGRQLAFSTGDRIYFVPTALLRP